MNFRPQFAFRTPPGFRDETFHYTFDATTNAALGVALAAGQTSRDNYLQGQNDAEFIVRAWRILMAAPGTSTLQIQIRDAFGNFLSFVSIPLNCYLTPAGAPVVGFLPVPMEPELVIPASGFLILDFVNLTTGAVTPPKITLSGVKRHPECKAA